MKKFAVFAFAALLVLAFTVPATAEVEHQFGGYWRTRFYMNDDFTGLEKQNPDNNDNATLVDTRTRLYYTAVLNENLKLVTKFEIDSTWGRLGYEGDDAAAAELGDVGADGKDLEIKNTYAEINYNEHIFRVGIQGQVFVRGFLFDSDVSGILWMHTAGNIMHIAAWDKTFEGDLANHDDVTIAGYAPHIALSEEFSIQPYIVYGWSSHAQNFLAYNDDGTVIPYDVDFSTYYLALNADHTTDAFSWWFSGIYQLGDIEFDPDPGTGATPIKDIDINAFLVALGGSIPFGSGDLHGQFFYATGDEVTTDNDTLKDPDESNAFSVAEGQSYYWAEIMGYGTFDLQVPTGSPADQISNIMAANIGITFKPNDKMTFAVDLWYAALAEERYNTVTAKNPTATKEDELGIEIDLKLTTQLVEGLNLDVVAAYLSAGDALGAGEEDPIEVGAQLSLSF
jgi:hypothetical protein